MASPAALASVLDGQEASPRIFGVMPSAVLGQGDPSTGYYPTRYAVPGQPAASDRAAGVMASLLTAPARAIFGLGQGIGRTLDQANQAMPWGGDNPQAIGLDPRMGTMDPSVMVPFASNVAGYATTGALAAPPVVGGAGTGMRGKLYHGSPTPGLTRLNPSDRGPLGPGVYASPLERTAGMYKRSDEGTMYQLPEKERDIYMGHGHRTDEEWFGFKDDQRRLIEATEPEKQGQVAAILEKMWSSDGYPTYQRILKDVYGGDEAAAQGLFQRAGFQGISGMVDGPEVLLFGEQSLSPGIRAYHGSPHDFDRFSMDKIGTGEGAQAYGRGLYFAENPSVAGQYKDNLATYKHIRDFNDANPQNRPGQVAQWQASGMELERMDEALKVLEPDSTQAMRDDWIRQGQKLHDEMASRGRMYEVDINASPDEFLDWDKPLSEQPAKVQAALGVTPEIRRALTDHLQSGRKKTDYDPETWRLMRLADDDPMGSTLAGNQPETAEALRSAGIKGIRYKDAGSRGKEGDGTSNYVVFDDNIIDILKKYGIAGLMAGGAGAAALGGSDPASASAPTYTTGGRF